MRKRWLMMLMAGILTAAAPAMNAGTLTALAADSTESTVSAAENTETQAEPDELVGGQIKDLIDSNRQERKERIEKKREERKERAERIQSGVAEILSNATVSPGATSVPTNFSISISTPLNGSVSISKTDAEEGEEVTINVSPSRGYVLDSLRVLDAGDRSITVNKGNGNTYTFTMPDSRVRVIPRFRKDDKDRPNRPEPGPDSAPKPADKDDQKKDNNATSKNTSKKTVTMYRLYNPNSGEHFYTAATYERDSLMAAGWNYEGVGWTAPKTGEPVYRLYNSNAGDHHYTVSRVEKDTLVALGWKYEGIGWYSGGKVPLYREYNPNAETGTHNYTRSKDENDKLISLGWREEGIGWYAEK